MSEFTNNFNNSNLFIYLDYSLINGLSSVFLNGYIQRTSLKNTWDDTITGKIDSFVKDHTQNDSNRIHQVTDGTIIDTKTRFKSHYDDTGNGNSLEGKKNVKIEAAVETIYTSFSLHRQLFSSMYSNNLIKPGINKNNINRHNFCDGEYIELRGEITCMSLVCYLDYLITIINSFYNCNNDNKNKLNELLKDFNPGIWNYTAISNVLTRFKELLVANGTEDIIMYCGEKPVILIVSSQCFLENTAHMFDKSNCCCNIFGKVAKRCNVNEKFTLLRKTGHPDYYDGFLKSIQPYIEILRQRGIPIPDPPKTDFDNNPLFVIPISMYL